MIKVAEGLYHYDLDMYSYVKEKIKQTQYDINEYLSNLVNLYGKPRSIKEQIGNYTTVEKEITYKELDYVINYLLYCKDQCNNCKYMTESGCEHKITLANILICRIYVKSNQKYANDVDSQHIIQDRVKTIKPRTYYDSDYCMFRETYVGVLPPNDNTRLLEKMLPTYRHRDYQKYKNGYEQYSYMYDDRMYPNTRK